jgi:hypothetical protein
MAALGKVVFTTGEHIIALEAPEMVSSARRFAISMRCGKPRIISR